MKLSQCAKILNGVLSGNDTEFKRAIIDSRTVQNGDCFFAIKGESFDGHDFIADAEKKGAAVAIIDREFATSIPTIRVANTHKALMDLARFYRELAHIPVAAITGSCGKTTTRALLENILKQAGNVLASQKSFNNDIGLPLTLFQLKLMHDFIVLEIGTNHPGEIAHLTQIAKPTVATITMAAAAHIQYFKTVEAVAREKGAIFENLTTDGIAVINADDAHADLWKTMAGKHKIMTFGYTHKADIMAENIQSTSDSKTSFTLKTDDQKIIIMLPLLGEHNITNALAAATMAFAMGVSIDAVKIGLETTQAVYGRMIEKKGIMGATIIDDTYNANPASVKAAITLLAHRSKNNVLVFGDMRELGDTAPQLHRDIGVFARETGLQQLFCYGENSAYTVNAFGKNAHHFDSHQALIDSLKSCLTKEMTVLVKGSRGMAMEVVVEALVEQVEVGSGRVRGAI